MARDGARKLLRVGERLVGRPPPRESEKRRGQATADSHPRQALHGRVLTPPARRGITCGAACLLGTYDERPEKLIHPSRNHACMPRSPCQGCSSSSARVGKETRTNLRRVPPGATKKYRHGTTYQLFRNDCVPVAKPRHSTIAYHEIRSDDQRRKEQTTFTQPPLLPKSTSLLRNVLLLVPERLRARRETASFNYRLQRNTKRPSQAQRNAT